MKRTREESTVPVAAVVGLSPTFTQNPYIGRQNPFRLVRALAVEDDPCLNSMMRSSDGLLFAVAGLLQAWTPASQLRERIRQGAAAMTDSAERVLGAAVVLDETFEKLNPVTHQHDTITAPFVMKAKLHGRHRDDALRALIDGSTRVVVKMNDINTIVPANNSSAEYPEYGVGARSITDQLTTVSIVCELVVMQTFLNLLRGGTRENHIRRHVVTPHFVRLVDAFYGPRLVSNVVHPTPTKPDVLFDAQQVAQYTVLERADASLWDMINADPTGAAKWGAGMPQVLTVVMQAILALEAAWEVGGFIHNDLHLGNFMVRRVVNPEVSKKVWVYRRRVLQGRKAAYFAIRPEVHKGWFASLIDFGESRAWCYDSAEPGAKRALVGNPTGTWFGRVAGVPDSQIDRSVDVRNLGISLLLAPLHLYHETLLLLSDELRRQFKHMVAMASNAYHIFGRIGALQLLEPDALGGKKWDRHPSITETVARLLQPRNRLAYELFWEDLKTRLLLIRINSNVSVDYLPTEEEGVRLFDAIQGALRTTTENVREYFGSLMRFVFITTSHELGYNQGNPALTPSSLLHLDLFLNLGSRGMVAPIDAPTLKTMMEEQKALVLGVVDESDVWAQEEDTHVLDATLGEEEAGLSAALTDNAVFVASRFFSNDIHV